MSRNNSFCSAQQICKYNHEMYLNLSFVVFSWSSNTMNSWMVYARKKSENQSERTFWQEFLKLSKISNNLRFEKVITLLKPKVELEQARSDQLDIVLCEKRTSWLSLGKAGK